MQSRSPTAGAKRPLRRYSQNFLVDTGIASRIVDAFAPAPGDTVIEVGPGRGALTTLLVSRTTNLHLIEIDQRLVDDLRERFPEVDVVAADVLDRPLQEAIQRPNSQLRLITNLPYAISSRFLIKLVAERATLVDALLLLQLEMVERVAAVPSTKAYGALSVAVQLAFDLTPLFVVPAGAFRPQPEVRSRLLRLVPRNPAVLDTVDERKLRELLRLGFGQRRKVLAKVLASGLGRPRPEIEQVLAQVGHDKTVRAEVLAPSAWLAITQALYPQ